MRQMTSASELLVRSWSSLRDFARSLRLRLGSASITSGDRLSRYLYKDREIDWQKGTAKPGAFQPPADNEFSVYRTTALDDGDVWWLAAKYVSPTRQARLRGRADFPAEAAMNPPLRVKPDAPPPRHCVITGWAQDDDLPVGQRLSVQQGLAKAATLVLHPDFPRTITAQRPGDSPRTIR